ncbi:hypothetical protein D3C75_1056720 [compost metagenome]
MLEHSIADQRLVSSAVDRNLPGYAEQFENFTGVEGCLLQRDIAADRGDSDNVELPAHHCQHNGQRIIHSGIYIQNDFFTPRHP